MKTVLLFAACVALGTSSLAGAQDLTWDNLMLASAKLRPHFDYRAYADSYMRIYRSELWKRYRADEFELQNKHEETVALMKRRVASFPLDEQFVVYGDFTFSDYDFDRGAFHIDGFGPNNYVYNHRYLHGRFPAEYRVFFDNTDIVGDLRMSADEAHEFLAARKDEYGNVDRRLRLKIEFVITGLGHAYGELIAKVTHVTVYGDRKAADVIARF